MIATNSISVSLPPAMSGVPQDEWRDRAILVPKARPINFGLLTEGETKLALVQEQAEILASYYPEVPALYDGARQLDNILRSGLHDGMHLPPGTPDFVRKAVEVARKKTNPNMGIFTKPRMSNSPGLGEVPLLNCNLARNSGESRAHHRMRERVCNEKNEDVRLLNSFLERTAHHLMYEFAKGNIPARVTTKQVLHRNAVSTFTELFEFPRDNMVSWLRNGVLRYNIQNNAPPLQPEETISRLGESFAAGIGEPLTIAAVTGIIAAVSAAAGATARLIADLKAERQNRIRNTAQGIGTPTFGPEKEDFEGGGGLLGGNSGTGILLIGGAAAFYFLSGNNKSSKPSKS